MSSSCKEEEYRRMNAELEEKTTVLAKEAEQLLEGNLSIISDLEASELQSKNPTLMSHDDGDASHDRNKGKLATKIRPSSTTVPRKPPPMSLNRPATSEITQPKPSRRSHDLDLPEDLLSAIQHLDFGHDYEQTSLPEGHDRGGGRKGQTEGQRRNVEELLPPNIDDMGAEASIRFLKAKLRVMQEEMDRLCEENSHNEKLVTSHRGRLKELEGEKAKLQGGVQSLSAQLEKKQQSAEDFKRKCWGLEGQLTSVRKDLDALKASQKRTLSQHSAVEVRLNRALEEVERYKDALQKAKSDARDSGKLDRQKLDQVQAQNKVLEKQRSELMTAFKKQMKLIDILKRQKMHIEAAKMLSLTEEEFVKALDWGAN